MQNKVLEDELRKFFSSAWCEELTLGKAQSTEINDIDKAITMLNFIRYDAPRHFSDECFNERQMLAEIAEKLRGGIGKAQELLALLEAHA